MHTLAVLSAVAALLLVVGCSGDSTPAPGGSPPETRCDDGVDDDLDGQVDCADTDCSGEPRCNPEPICDDGLDNDLDGLADCTDPDCDGFARCEVGAEESCSDGFDNDADGGVDCGDEDCASDVRCIPEPVCDDGRDDDLDGAIDCADADCDGVGSCEYDAERSCADRLDNDVDGSIDCADAECASTDWCARESDCGDGLDDDGDDAADCLDPGCDGTAGCEFGTERSCRDGRDNDGDGSADCADTDCTGLIACRVACPANAVPVTMTASGLPAYVDNTSPAILSLAGPASSGVLTAAVLFTIRHTYDADLDISLTSPWSTTLDLSSDNGFNGDDYVETLLTDAASTPVSAGSAPFTGEYRPEQPFSLLTGQYANGTWTVTVADDLRGDSGSVESFAVLLCTCSDTNCEPLACRDGLDTDGDGLVDCDDPDCALDAYCIPEPVCDNGLDDDLDGLADCKDPDCDRVARCEFGAEASCSDGFDNDADGFADCLDSDCATTQLCTAEANCGDGIDDDRDGATDCLDPGCDGILGCEFGAETSCDDALDNDADGLVDCDDGDCSATGICDLLGLLACGPTETRIVLPATGLPVEVPDASDAPAIDIPITVGDSGSVTNVAVAFSAVHTWDGDLSISLVAPDATVVDLSSGNGGGGDGYAGTVFTDGAATWITEGTAPFAGAYRPEQPLLTLYGKTVTGDWILRVDDTDVRDVGTVTAYAIGICVGPWVQW